MPQLKINTQAYKKKNMKDNAFKNFATTVVNKGKDNPDYADQADTINDVEKKGQAYSASLTLAESYGGTDRTEQKDNDRITLTEAMDQLVEELEKAAPSKPDPVAFLTYLGFELVKTPSRKTGTVKDPTIQSLKSGCDDARRGVVKCVLVAEDASEIKGVEGMRSDDNGLTWVGGIFSTKLTFEMLGQPSGVYALYQFRFIATNNRKSDWCPFKGVSVS